MSQIALKLTVLMVISCNKRNKCCQKKELLATGRIPLMAKRIISVTGKILPVQKRIFPVTRNILSVTGRIFHFALYVLCLYCFYRWYFLSDFPVRRIMFFETKSLTNCVSIRICQKILADGILWIGKRPWL